MKNKIFLIAAFCSLIFSAACNNNKAHGTIDSTSTTTVKRTEIVNVDTNSGEDKAAEKIKPRGTAPSWAPDIAPQMLAVIEKLDSYGNKPIPTLTASEVRKNRSEADAVKDLLVENKLPLPVYKVDTVDKDIKANGANIHLRIYTPKTGSGTRPVIVFYHGGGFVIGSIDLNDASANILSERTSAIVVSVAYRLGPEYKFPTAHNDAFAAYQWVLDNAASIKGDPQQVVVAGESAGGNLAISVAIMARDKGTSLPAAILAIYPMAGADLNTSSYIKYANAKILNKPTMEWFYQKYLGNMAQIEDPRINLVAANLSGLPPIIVITDEIDPLQSEDITLIAKLKAAGVNVSSKNFEGVTHGFFGMGYIVPQAKNAEFYAVSQLKRVLSMD